MINEFKFAFYAIKKNIINNAELRGSFFMNVFGMFLNDITFVIVWIFFVKTVGIIGGWSMYDILGLQGFSAVCFGVVLSVGAGLRQLAAYVSSGVFDGFLLSPKNLLMRLTTASFNASAVGDIIFGATCLVIYGFVLHASLYQILILFLLVFITSIVFFAFTLLAYSISFFFIDAESVATGIFDFFLSPSLFHGGAFQGAMRFFFTFVVPSLLIGTLPVEIVRDLSVEKLLLVLILTIFWFFFSIWFFYRAVRRYESSNFMTFGN